MKINEAIHSASQLSNQIGVPMKNSNLCLAIFIALACTLSCSKKSSACRIVERTESKVLSIYKNADMKFNGIMGEKTVDQQSLEWKANMEMVCRQDLGDIETISNFIKFLEANNHLELERVKYLRKLINEMELGNQVPEEGQLLFALFGLPKDGKTNQQRIQEYKPRIEKNKKTLAARIEAAETFQAASEQLKQLAK